MASTRRATGEWLAPHVYDLERPTSSGPHNHHSNPNPGAITKRRLSRAL